MSTTEQTNEHWFTVGRREILKAVEDKQICPWADCIVHYSGEWGWIASFSNEDAYFATKTDSGEWVFTEAGDTEEFNELRYQQAIRRYHERLPLASDEAITAAKEYLAADMKLKTRDELIVWAFNKGDMYMDAMEIFADLIISLGLVDDEQKSGVTVFQKKD